MCKLYLGSGFCRCNRRSNTAATVVEYCSADYIGGSATIQELDEQVVEMEGISGAHAIG
jgi:hypothetical protein